MEISASSNNAITSIKFDIQEMGTTACRTLINLIDGQDVKPVNLLGYDIILKSSTQSV